MDIIIPAANKKDILFKNNNKNNLKYNLGLLQENIPNCNISIVINPKSEFKQDNLTVFVNNDFLKTSSVRSIQIAAENQNNSNCLIIHGNLKISQKVFKFLNFDSSFVVVGENKTKDCLGLYEQNKNIITIEYGLPKTYYDIVYLKDKELNLFKKIINNHNRNKHKLYEVINEVIKNGGEFKTITVSNQYIKELK